MIRKAYLGDCLNIMQKIESNSVDMILCDLPYGTTKCSWDIIIPLDKLWEQYNRIIKDKGIICLTSSQPFTSMLIMSNLKMFKYCLVWEKTKAANYVNANRMPMKYHEDIIIFGHGTPTYNPQMIRGKPYIKKAANIDKGNSVFVDTRKIGDVIINNGMRYPSSIIKISNSNNDSIHPTQKPLALFEYLIKTYTNESDLVLDNCAGSFTTAIACDNLKRQWICIEKEYCELGIKRINENARYLKRGLF